MKATVKMLMALSLVLLSAVTSVVQAEAVRPTISAYSSVELVSEVSSVKPGQTFTLGLVVTPDVTWHNYWMNPGEAGLEMKIRWKDLPEGVVVDDFVYEIPHIVAMGDIVTYGYSEPNTITMNVSVPADYAGDSLTLGGKSTYLVCDDGNCVMQNAQVSITLPVGDGAVDAGNTEIFTATRAHQPESVEWSAAVYVPADGASVNFEVAFPEDGAKDIYVWPVAHKLIKHTHDQNGVELDNGQKSSITIVNGVLKANLPATANLAGKLEKDATKAPEKRKYDSSGLMITYTDASGNKQAKFIADAPRVDAAGTVDGAAAAGGDDDDLGILYAIILAFGGGLVLNLMPCVLPVLSLKMLSLAKMGDSHPREVRSSGIYYTVGVLVSFMVMAAIVIAIKAAGEAASWGFQMTNPIFVLSMVMLMTLIGMNLLGAFEFGTSMMGVGSNLTEGEAHSNKSSFWTGVLAVVVATPCTAPMMAPALGYAFTLPWYGAMVIFLGLGMGLAFPYLLIAFVPGARRIVPSPGPWMSIFKTALAFPMFATAAWLIWVLGSKDAMVWAIAAALAIALGGWAWGKIPMATRPVAWKVTAVLALAVTVGLGYLAIDRKEISITMRNAAKVEKTETIKTINALKAALKEAAQSGGELSAEAQALLDSSAGGSHAAEMPYTEKDLMELLANGQPVFAYFTADWCVSCKVNEKTALHRDETTTFLAENGIQVMVGDDTDGDPEIAKLIQLYKHPGVPLYLYYKPGDSLKDGRKLPQLLPTPSVLIDGIKEFRGEL